MRFLIISSSIREGRLSHRVALFWQSYLARHGITPTLLDLQEKQYPLFSERLKFMPSPPREAVEVSEMVREADAVIIVAPEYNGSFPASLKNVIDLLNDEWRHQPVGISSVGANF